MRNKPSQNDVRAAPCATATVAWGMDMLHMEERPLAAGSAPWRLGLLPLT